MIRLVSRVTYQRVVGESQSVYRAGKEDRVVEKMKGVIHNTDIAVVGIFLFRCRYFRVDTNHSLAELVN